MEETTQNSGKGARKQAPQYIGTLKEKKNQRSAQKLLNKPVRIEKNDNGGMVK